MIGLVIVAHGGLARELLAALEHVVGPQAQAQTVAVAADDDLGQCHDRVCAAIREVDQGSGVAVITDMFGGTPSNLAVSAATETHLAALQKRSAQPGAGPVCGAEVEIIYGANLPLLVKLAKLRCRPLHEAIARAVDSGRKYVNATGALLPAERRGAAAS